MSNEVVRSEVNTLHIFPCVLCNRADRGVWKYVRYSSSGVNMAALGHIRLCQECAGLLKPTLAPEIDMRSAKQ